MTQDHLECRNPVFILTSSRSGSTLLRFILDTHPEFACPPETMITGACVALMKSWDILQNAGSGSHRRIDSQVELPAEALITVRGIVDQVYGKYLAERGKPRWCDKSLDTVYNAGLLAALYPEAKFICLYRHAMDVVASGVEACPWGLSRFGFDPYVAQMPGNSVAAIGAYWMDCAQAMLEFEQQQPSRCFRLRYEDLVTAPEEVAAGLLEFLGAAPAPGITAAAFAVPHEGDGPGDEKIWFTTKVNADALGRGVQVPAAAIPEPMRHPLNHVLGMLGYRQVDDDWNSATSPIDPRALNGASSQPSVTPDAVTTGVAIQLADRIAEHGDASPEEYLRRWPALAGQEVRLVVAGDSAARQQEVLWRFAGQADPAVMTDGPVMTMIAGPAIWRALLDGEANVITEIRTGRLRCVNRRDAARVRSDEVHAIAWLLGLAQVPLVRK